MKIRIVAVGKRKERYWKEAEEEYVKRISPFAQVEVIEVADEKMGQGLTDKAAQAVLKKEGERVLFAVRGYKWVFALASEGEMYDSLAFSQKISDFAKVGTDIAFVIGGSLGLSDEVKDSAAGLLSLSKLTFPHRIARIVLLEQIYRAFKILNNQTYHK